ncbi:ABC transporter permease [Streptomyces sp. NBC_00656]|uniref:ABC transporter permease n=1 Tax=Streptomyces sp. NBC_00656 TaxID=2903668 RepID=UPI00324DEBFD
MSLKFDSLPRPAAAPEPAEAGAGRRGRGLPPPRTANLLGALVRQPGRLVAALWLLAIGIAALTPGALTSRDPLAVRTADRLRGPSAQHLLGTDQLGRDLFARLVHGTGLSLVSAALATLVGLVAGSALGLLAGFLRSGTDMVIMRLVDMLLSIPGLLLSLALIAAIGPGARNVAIAVGLTSVATCARVVRSEVLRVRESLSVEAAQSSGARPLRVLTRHVLPNAMGPVRAMAALEFGTALLAVSALSFLGYGVQPPTPEWGALISEGRDSLSEAWWLTTFPGLAVAATVVASNRLARSLGTDRTEA